MILAVEQLSEGWTALFYCAAVVLFVIAGLLAILRRVSVDLLVIVALVAFGLACGFFVPAWNALAAA